MRFTGDYTSTNPEITSFRSPTLTEPDRNAVRSCRRWETQKQLRFLTRRAIHCSISLRTRQGQAAFGGGCIMPPVQNLKTALLSGITKALLQIFERVLYVIRVIVCYGTFHNFCFELCGTDFYCSNRLRLIKSTHLLYYVRNAYHINLALWFKCIFARRSWILCRFQITVRLTSNLWFQVI